ncbi:MAG: response regulator [Gemmatimonadetes bacterium]|nr:MAG: response regulator [Gemmatimonadota bacterium]
MNDSIFPRDERTRTILIVDDERTLVQIVSKMVEGAGYQTLSANSGPQALALLASESVDLVLLDIMMPGVSGYEVCREIKATYPDYLPVIMVTAKRALEDKVSGFEHGADDYVVKPFHSTELLARIKAMLRIKAMHEQHQQMLKRVSAEKSKLKAVFNSTRDGLITLAGDHPPQVSNVNRIVTELFHCKAIELIGLPLDDLIHRCRKTFREGDALATYLRDPNPGDEVCKASTMDQVFEVSRSPVVDAGGVRVGEIISFHEITKSHQLAELRDDVSHMLVHDLKNPLAAILTSLQVVMKSQERQLAPANVELLESAYHSGLRLMGMIGDILDVYRSDASALLITPETFDLVQLILEAIAEQRIFSTEKEITLEFEPLADVDASYRVLADRHKIYRVLTNLIDNAIQFTPRGGIIRVQLDRLADQFQISVIDTGEGIPAEFVSKVFDRFSQAEARIQGKKISTGLGLAFCKLVVEAHHGTISVQSQLGQGSIFRFTLPIPTS